MPKKLWPTRPLEKDPSPDDYADPSLEITRIVRAPDGAAIFAARCWDMEDFDQQHSVLFRVRDFAEPGERLCAIDKQIMDVDLRDGALWVLVEGSLHRFSLDDLAKPAESIALKGEAQRAMASLDNGQRYIVGDTIAWFDGKKWREVETDDELELLAVCAMGDGAVAVGADGAIVSLRDGAAARIEVETDERLNGVRVDRDNTLWIAGEGGTRLRGPLSALARVESDFEGDLNASCVFRGQVYWSAAFDEGGLFRESGSKLECVFDEICFDLTATEDAIYVASAALAVRYTPDDVLVVSIEHDDERSQWVALPAEPVEE